MTNRLGVLVLLVGASTAVPAFAGDTATMKCNATQDRIWVYDSLTSFDVTAKLKCGETVEITGRVKGYVKIHAANGVEGYVPDSTFPNLPPFVDPNDQQPSVSIAKRVAPRAAAQPAAAAPAPAAAVSSPAPTATPATSALPLNASTITISPANSVAQVQPSANSAPASTAVVRTVAESAPTPVTVPSAPATTMAVTGVTSAKSSSPSSAKKPNPAPAATAKSQPVPPPAAQPAAPPPAPHAPALTSTSATVSSKSSSPASAGKTANNKSATAQPQPSGGAHPAPTPSVPAPAVISPAKPVETTMNVQPQPAREVPSVHTVSATESDEYPEDQPENASADPACRTFFSAYGLSPAQFKWIAQNRKKQFSSICPAPDVSKVDYVIIFTHDVDFFGSTLPTVVHTDHNGFSDFSPMSMIDTALVPLSEADKSHHEYVWVFKMQRGNFDPAKFSPRRRPQFSKTESHAPARTVEEAFRFIESGGTSQ
jgi:hypothetical protein